VSSSRRQPKRRAGVGPSRAVAARQSSPPSAAKNRIGAALKAEPRAAEPAAPVRRVGSPLSRLTIKPGPPQGPRTILELSTKPRPSGPRPLSQVELDEDEVLIDGFEATLEGRRVRVTAVLERTCVYIDGTGDRRLVRKQDLVVEADKLPIRRRGFG